ncbi:spore cortex-lytic enzyme [Alteribacter populi]|uniref:spore cortex-lytic enzyme n=1 Tax=Alteribacter populi TaxID=2011011 RepID=UPI000BBAFE03|nr:spore cortex-lytic enzyme [Alteribacter populi]
MKSQEIRRLKRMLFAALVCMQFVIILPSMEVDAFTDQIIQKGATGDDVVELQSRLQYIGFYNETIDGVYGWGTYWSVKKYQEEFGLEVDGLVGTKMKQMLKKSTDFDKEYVHRMLEEGRKFTYYGDTPKDIQKGPKGSKDQKAKQEHPPSPGQEQEQQRAPEGEQPEQPAAEEPVPEEGAPAEEAPPEEVPAEDTPAEEAPQEQDNDADIQKAINTPEGFTDNDIQIMAAAVYGEARGEPYVGQVAVAAVILNRIESPTFPNTASGVIYEPRAFTAVADGQINLEPDETARRAVMDAINGQDPSGGVEYYFNPDTATSDWIWTRRQVKRIGKHVFCE